jgi:hypothetical protein
MRKWVIDATFQLYRPAITGKDILEKSEISSTFGIYAHTLPEALIKAEEYLSKMETYDIWSITEAEEGTE